VTKRDFLSWQSVARVVGSRLPDVSLKVRLTAPFVHKGTLMAEMLKIKASISMKENVFILFWY